MLKTIMSSFVSTKQLLSVYDITSIKDDEGKPTRGTAHEFQDYAYRLAANLNDLEHLQIYMRLTKAYPRYLLDQAYESIADSNSESKGKLFMWKFKKIRGDIQLKRDLGNYDYDHVIKKMKSVRNKLGDKIIQKNDLVENNSIVRFLPECPKLFSEEIKNILILGSVSTLLPSMLSSSSKKISGIDISSGLTKKLKEYFKKLKGRKFITKDFLNNSYNIHQFDSLIIQNYWDIIPLESELTYIKEFQRIVAPDSYLILNTKVSDTDTQSWKESKLKGEPLYFFQKQNELPSLIKKFETLGFYEIERKTFETDTVLLFSHKV